MAHSPEKRRVPRIQPFVTPCRIVSGERRWPGYLVDLSLRGARVSTAAAPPPGEASLVLEVRLGPRVARTRLPGRVKWVRPAEGGHLFGVVFEDLAVEAERAIAAVVEEFRARAAALDPGR